VTWSLSIAGIIADLVGVAFIAWSHFTTRPEMLREMASSQFDLNPDLLKSLAEAKADNILGFAFLFGGFVLQLASAIFPQAPAWIDIGFVIAVIVAALLAASLRIRLARHIERIALK
jgi:hypothetical protein